MTTLQTSDLKLRWKDLLLKNPRLRIRDAADALKVSEAELLATQCGETVIRLEGKWSRLLEEFPRLGEVMCLTRNQAAVHERHGTFIPPIAFFGQMGQVTGPEIDLRLFMSRWRYGFAVQETGGKSSFQFFDPCGIAVHKVYLTEKSSLPVFEKLIRKFRSADQANVQQIVAGKELERDRPDEEIDVEKFHQAWLTTTDTHEFTGLLRKFGVNREQALRLAPRGYAWQVSAGGAIQRMLEMAASEQLPIMVFVSSPGCIQIHTGSIQNVKRTGDWLNILDERFSFHLNEALVASVWIAKKVTKDGFVTSLEIFDSAGRNVVLFFGGRKPGEAESPRWQRILAAL